MAVSYDMATTSNYAFTCETRLYRDDVLISTQTLNQTGSQEGTQIFPVHNTFVDIAVANTTSNYEVRAIITAQTNLSSASALNRNLNFIRFS